MNSRLIALVVVLVLLGYPIVFSVIRTGKNLVKIARFKNEIASFGKEIVPLNRTPTTNKSLKLMVVGTIFVIIVGIVAEFSLIFLGDLILIASIVDLVLIRKFSQYNGIYENGIVFGGFIEWKDVASWKKTGDTEIAF